MHLQFLNDTENKLKYYVFEYNNPIGKTIGRAIRMLKAFGYKVFREPHLTLISVARPKTIDIATFRAAIDHSLTQNCGSVQIVCQRTGKVYIAKSTSRGLKIAKTRFSN